MIRSKEVGSNEGPEEQVTLKCFGIKKNKNKMLWY